MFGTEVQGIWKEVLEHMIVPENRMFSKPKTYLMWNDQKINKQTNNTKVDTKQQKEHLSSQTG